MAASVTAGGVPCYGTSLTVIWPGALLPDVETEALPTFGFRNEPSGELPLPFEIEKEYEFDQTFGALLLPVDVAISFASAVTGESLYGDLRPLS